MFFIASIIPSLFKVLYASGEALLHQ